MFGFANPEHMPCPECGASVACSEARDHACEHERWLDYQMFRLREEIAGFDGALGSYLSSPRGRFELWWAERHRPGEAGS